MGASLIDARTGKRPAHHQAQHHKHLDEHFPEIFDVIEKWLRFVAHFAKIKEAPPIHLINLRAFNLAYVERVFESTISPAAMSAINSSSRTSNRRNDSIAASLESVSLEYPAGNSPFDIRQFHLRCRA
jgi:hypothetical protein